MGYPVAVLVTAMVSYSHFFNFFFFIYWYVLSSGLHKGWELAGLIGLEENLTRLRLVGHSLPKYIHSLVTASPESPPSLQQGTVL